MSIVSTGEGPGLCLTVNPASLTTFLVDSGCYLLGLACSLIEILVAKTFFKLPSSLSLIVLRVVPPEIEQDSEAPETLIET